MNRKQKVFNRSRNRIIVKLTALQKKYGEPIFSSAMRHKLLFDKENTKALREISELQKRMEQLKKGIAK